MMTIRSRTLQVIGALVLCFFDSGLAIAQQNIKDINDAEIDIASASARLFDDLCIKDAYDEEFFYAAMGKTASRKLTPEEYTGFLPSAGESVDFFDIPILRGSADIFIGRIAYSDGGRNCIVVLKSSSTNALSQWMALYKYKYRSKSKLEGNNSSPLYFVDINKKKSVMVQIANIGKGLMSYYTYFK